MSYRRLAKIALVAGFLGLSFFGASSVSAASEYASRTEWGAQDISAYGDNNNVGYNRSISGASWYYYKIPNADTKKYTDNDRIYVPTNDYTPKVAIPAKTCQEYGGFWVLLRNEYNRETGALTNRPASAVKLSDIRSTDLPAGLSVPYPTNIITFIDRSADGESDDSIDGVRAKYGSMNDVLTAYNSYVGTTAIPLAAAENIGELSYFCAGTKPSQQIPLNSFSTVTVSGGATSAPVLNGASYLGAADNPGSAIAVPVGSALPDVTFNSYLARPFSEYDLNGVSDIDYTISTSGDSGSGKIAVSSLNNRENRWNFNGTNYLYSDKVTKTVSGLGPMGNSSRTICQKITFASNDVYNSSTLKLEGSQEVSSEACVTFVPVPSLNGNVVTNCEEGGDGKYKYRNSAIGNTVATVGVSKNNGPLEKTTAAATVNPSTVKIYAKPGDVIRFSYAICFGANDVNYNGHMVTQEQAAASGNQISSWFRVYLGAKNDDQPEVYSLLFGNQNELLGGSVYADKSELRAGKFKFNYDNDDGSDEEEASSAGSREEYTITNSNYWTGIKRQLAFSSPDDHADVSIKIGDSGSSSSDEDESDNTVDGYGCTFYSGLSSNKVTGYVVPGFEGNINDIDCDSATGPKYSDGTPITSAVGATINHSLEYSYVAAWPIQEHQKKIVAALEDIINGYNNAYDHISSLSGLSGRAVSSGNAEADTVTKTASVAIPYNFDTNITGKITNNNLQIVYPGETLNYAATVDVLPRENPVTSDKVGDKYVPYATTMPPATKVELVQFLIKDTTDPSIRDSVKQDYSPEAAKTTEICEYYSTILGDELSDCETHTVKGLTGDDPAIGNGTSNPEGEQGYYNEETPFVVPDIRAGYKYCIAVAVSYGDSHGFPGQSLSANENDPNFGANSASVNTAFYTSVPYHWRTANASCRTVAKKPSFQAWNSGVYSSDNITATVTEKSVNARLSNLPPGSEKPADSEDARKVAADPVYFGSWAEYYVVAKGKISGFASASALGFTTKFGSLTTNGHGSSYDYCDMSRLTVANVNCKSKTAGEYTAKGDIDTKDLKREITDFYIPPASALSNASYSGTYAGSLSGVNSSDYFPGGWNGAQILVKNGDFVIDQPISHTSGTLVIKVNGHLTINGNICLGDGTCKVAGYNDYSAPHDYAMYTNNLSLADRNTTSFSAVKDIPQVVIIAESISIGGDVSQIDAWLVTNSEKENYDGGYVNTCNEFQSGQTGTSKCWKTLKINGPVVTTALLLNRTGGSWPGYSGDVGNQAYNVLSQDKIIWREECIASGVTGKRKINNCVNEKITNYVNNLGLNDQERIAMLSAYAAADRYGAQSNTYSANRAESRDLTCDGSITPAEIFDLHPIVYFWAYGQSQKIAQAIITYAQEFAPRY